MNWKQSLDLFSLRCQAQNLSARTRQLYRDELRLFTKWANPTFPLDVTPLVIRCYLNECRERGLSSYTVHRRFRILRTLFRFLHRECVITENPIKNIEPPRIVKKQARAFTVEEIKAIIKQIHQETDLGSRDYALILLLADTGLRLSEALSIPITSLNLGKGLVRVMGKGGKEREVAFGIAVRRALVNWLARRGDIASKQLFVNRFGVQLHSWQAEHRIRGYVKAAGIPTYHMNAHALRHFFAVEYLRNGGDIMTLQKQLGHTTLDMVRVYVAMSTTDLSRVHATAGPLDRIDLPGFRRVMFR